MAKKYYWLCQTIKLHKGLRDQLLRASSSIPLNIAEGSGKPTVNDRKRFYGIALGSLRECQAILEIQKIDRPDLFQIGDCLGAILFTLSRKSQ